MRFVLRFICASQTGPNETSQRHVCGHVSFGRCCSCFAKGRKRNASGTFFEDVSFCDFFCSSQGPNETSPTRVFGDVSFWALVRASQRDANEMFPEHSFDVVSFWSFCSSQRGPTKHPQNMFWGRFILGPFVHASKGTQTKCLQNVLLGALRFQVLFVLHKKAQTKRPKDMFWAPFVWGCCSCFAKGRKRNVSGTFFEDVSFCDFFCSSQGPNETSPTRVLGTFRFGPFCSCFAKGCKRFVSNAFLWGRIGWGLSQRGPNETSPTRFWGRFALGPFVRAPQTDTNEVSPKPSFGCVSFWHVLSFAKRNKRNVLTKLKRAGYNS